MATGSLADMLAACIQCGRCLPSCPTYRVLGTEAESPRGRMWLMRSLWDERTSPASIGVEASAAEAHLRSCLDCRACEVACPSQVQFSTLLGLARAKLDTDRRSGSVSRLIRLAVLRQIIGRPRTLALIARLVHLARSVGAPVLGRLASKFSWAERMSELLMLVPLWSPSSAELPPVVVATGERRACVALFTGCVMRAAFGGTHAATARVFMRNGIEVRVPPEQRCCGALHEHNGDHAGARELARRNIAIFEKSAVEAIVVNAAGCGAHLKSYGALLRDDPSWAERAATFSSSVNDAAEYLARVGLTSSPGRLDVRVAYQDPCHLLHAQRIRSQPRALLRVVPGVQTVPIADAEMCCGSAGTYNVTHPEIAGELRARKVANISRAAPTILVTVNPGCHIQIEAGLRARGSDIRVMHLMDLLDAAYGALPEITLTS